MADLFIATGIFVLEEVLALVLFRWVRHALPGEREAAAWWDIETFKGLIERLMIYVGLLMGYPHILTLFAALKLANRVSDESPDHDDMKNYFLVGNLLSVLFVLAAVAAVRALTALS